MKINKLLLSAITIPCIGITSALSISCERNEVNSQQQEFKMPLNHYFDDRNQKIFDENMWKKIKSIDEVNYDFIKSTVIQNESSKYNIGFHFDEKYIIKNKDLNFVSFYYRYWDVNSEIVPKNWMVQTVYFDFELDEGVEITLDQYWDLAEGKAQSNSNSQNGYKRSFESSTNHYPNDYPGNLVFKDMSQNGSHYYTLLLNIIKQSLWEKNLEEKFFEKSQAETYSRNNDYFWKTFSQNKSDPNEIIITYLTKANSNQENVRIKIYTKKSNKYIKFQFPPRSIKVNYNNQEYFNDFDNTFYINVTNWF